MKLIKVDKNVISGQCYASIARIQIGYTAYFVDIGWMPRGWQGLQFGFFAPGHNPEIGYRRCVFYAKFLPALSGPIPRWPKWYRFIHKCLKFRVVFGEGFH